MTVKPLPGKKCYIESDPAIARCHICSLLVCEAHSAGYVIHIHLCNRCFTKLRAFFESGKQPKSVAEEIEKHLRDEEE